MARSWTLVDTICISRKLINTNGNTKGIFPSIDCGEFYRKNIPSLYPSVNTDINIFSIYTEKITQGKEGIKKNQNV